jgi:hypothetical protein
LEVGRLVKNGFETKQAVAAGAPKSKSKRKKGEGDASRVLEARKLYSASKSGDWQAVRLLWEGHAEDRDCGWQDIVNWKFDDGYTSLMTASEAGHAQVVEFLLEKGAKVFIKNAYGQAAIHLAVLHGRTDVVGTLLRSNQTRHEVVSSEHQGAIPLTWAAQSGNDGIVASLLHAKSDVNHGGDRTPLRVAVSHGWSDVVGLLVPHADARWMDSCGRTVLYHAVTAQVPDPAIVRLLTERPGCNLRQKYAPLQGPGKSTTLAEIARTAKHVDLVELLTPARQPQCQCVVS